MNFYNDIPIGKENAISKEALANIWGVGERKARQIIAELRAQDNGDNYIICSSSSSKEPGYFRTDNPEEIRAYKNETINRARHTFRPLNKVNRVLALHENARQYVIEFNNLKAARIAAGYSGSEIVEKIRAYDKSFDKSILSKIENNKCLPTALQLSIMAELYGMKTEELTGAEFVRIGE